MGVVMATRGGGIVKLKIITRPTVVRTPGATERLYAAIKAATLGRNNAVEVPLNGRRPDTVKMAMWQAARRDKHKLHIARIAGSDSFAAWVEKR